MLQVSCHCGQVCLTAHVHVASLTSCNCSLCQRIGALWAYYVADQVRVEVSGELATYQWGKQLRSYHFCKRCGCTSHYTQMRENGLQRVAINARLADPDSLVGIPVRKFDGAVSFAYVDAK